MLYYLYMTGFFLARVVPLRFSYVVAELIARIYFLMAFRDRRVLRENMEVVIGPETSRRELNRNVLGIFKNFAKYLVDFFRFPRFTEDFISSNIDIQGRQNLDACLAQGRGAILVAPHLGNWELGAALVGGLGYEIYAIVLEHSNPRINDFFMSQRAINGVGNIPTGRSIKRCFKVLSRNKVLAIAADKDYTSTGVEVDFFGRKALLPRGAAVMALRTGAPIIFTVLTREKGDKFRLVFERPLEYDITGDSEQDVKTIIEGYASLFEEYIRKYPDQWYAFTKVWSPR